MKLFKPTMLLLSFSMFFIFSCVKDQLNDYANGAAGAAKLPGQTTGGEKSNGNNNVALCHYDEDNGTWHVINVNQNAVPAHLAHGDVILVDADGDGWVAAANQCVPGGDCDDANPAVNPGAAEVCDNGIDDNCNGETDEGCSACPDCSFSEILNDIDLTDACRYDAGGGVWFLFTYGAYEDTCCGIVVFPDGFWVTGDDYGEQSGTSSTECYACFVEYLDSSNVPTCEFDNLNTNTGSRGNLFSKGGNTGK
jgi:Putative metal-binding motif